jgi:NAD(P)-dependent dehydrogenase (short-subunit alcohol dehydrogenase family)
MPTALITGANRGIGLEFVRQYAGDGWRVHACCRTPGKARELASVAGDIAVHRLDVRSTDQLRLLKEALGREPIDVLINNAGIMGAEAAIGRIDEDEWLEAYRVNAIAPLRIADALAASVARSETRVMAFITSGLASLAQADDGSLVYRMSKAALNMGVRVLAASLAPRGITCVVLAPGWVKTDMGGASAPVDPRTSIRGMRRLIDGLTRADTGGYYDYRGKVVPW